MANTPFTGRKTELARLSDLYQKKIPALVVVKGRRRIGKSRLVHFFTTTYAHGRLWDFAGLAPQGDMDDQTQRDQFARQLAADLKSPPFSIQDWSDGFAHLQSHIKAGDVILFDEISWMADKDPTFIPKLKAWWDTQSLPVMLVFCGSISTWIEENILKSTAFFGRVNLTLTLQPLPIPDAYNLLKRCGFQGSDYDTFKLMSILGGVPWYLEQIIPGQTTNEMIKRLCFEQNGLLVLEFERIFHDLFAGKGTTYRRVLDALKDGMKTLTEIRNITDAAHSGTMSRIMEHLVTAGFVAQQQLWSFKTQKPSKQSLYRILDPYIRFYLKLIEPQLNKINLNGFETASPLDIPGFDAHLGLQIEHLLLQNQPLLIKALDINPSDIIASGPYRQSKNSTRSGCQIDYLIQTRTHNLFVCEFKFKRKEIGIDITQDMQNKINALKIPRGFAAIPVLFHISGVSTKVATQDYFYRIIDITDFLAPVDLESSSPQTRF